jgi:hypothetical protein
MTLIIQLINKNLNRNETKGVIVGTKLDEALEENLALQGLEYEAPHKIYNSSSYYMPVSVMTYQEAIDMKKEIASANNYGYSLMSLTNVMFLDSTWTKTHWLLDKKAAIGDIKIRGIYSYDKDEKIDSNYKYLLFEIGFEDSNKDGHLNNEDLHDLYISDLNGENLLKITKNIDLIHYEFNDSYSSVLIQYKERDNSLKEEHKLLKFGEYQIESGEFVEYRNVNTAIKEYHSKINTEK